jgi:hypothetical protein
MKKLTVLATFLMAIMNQLSWANTFFCAGRAGPFQMTFEEDKLIVGGLGGKTCVLPQDKSYNSDDHAFFQVLGTYDYDDEELKKLNLPELLSPEGYHSYADSSNAQSKADCSSIFGGQEFRNIYVLEEMKSPQPSNYERSVINVFKSPKGWPVLYVNFCVQKKK